MTRCNDNRAIEPGRAVGVMEVPQVGVEWEGEGNNCAGALGQCAGRACPLGGEWEAEHAGRQRLHVGSDAERAAAVSVAGEVRLSFSML